MDPALDTMRRLEVRLNLFMAEPSVEQARRLREGYTVELRNKRRTDALIKRRTQTQPETEASVHEVTKFLQTLDPRLDALLDDRSKMQILKDILAGQHAQTVHLKALTLFKDILITGNEICANLSVEIGLAPYIIELCRVDRSEDVVAMSTWCLCNMASGDETTTDVLLSLGAIDTLMTQLSSQNPVILEHTIWAIGNFAGSSNDIRELLIEKQVIEKLDEITASYSESLVNVYSVIAWTCTNLLRGLPVPELDISLCATSLLTRLATHDMTKKTSLDLMAAIANFTEHENYTISMVINSTPLFEYVLSNLKSRDISLLKSALLVAGNIIAGNHYHTQKILDSDILGYLAPMLENLDSGIRKEAYWSLSNIAASSKDHVQIMMSHPLMDRAPYGLIDRAEPVAKEASYLFSNLCKAANDDFTLKLVYQFYILDHIAQALTSNCNKTLMNLLNICHMLLDVGCRSQSYQPSQISTMFIDKGCVEAIEHLLNSDHRDVSEAAELLLKKYFDESQASCDHAVPEVFNFS